jgi:Lon protease-like protein
MDNTVSIFPIDVVVYPNQTIPLRIFEPRYRQMLDKCMSEDRTFAISTVNPDKKVGGWDGPNNVGTLVYVTKCEDLDLTGTNYYIEIVGKERIEIIDLIKPQLDKPIIYNPPHNPSMKTMLSKAGGGNLYFQARVKKLPKIEGQTSSSQWNAIVTKLEERIRDAAKRMGVSFDDFDGFVKHNELDIDGGSVMDLYNISSMCSLSVETQQAILEASTIDEIYQLIESEL